MGGEVCVLKDRLWDSHMMTTEKGKEEGRTKEKIRETQCKIAQLNIQKKKMQTYKKSLHSKLNSDKNYLT
jgi:hypothetical protein